MSLERFAGLGDDAMFLLQARKLEFQVGTLPSEPRERDVLARVVKRSP